MDPELRKQVAVMIGQQAIEIVEGMLHVQQLEAELAELRQAFTQKADADLADIERAVAPEA